MTDAEEIAELNITLVEINKALLIVPRVGQSYTLGSGASSRSVTNVDYNALVARKSKIERRLKELFGTAGYRIGAGW